MIYFLNYGPDIITEVVGVELGQPFNRPYQNEKEVLDGVKLFIQTFPELDSSLLSWWYVDEKGKSSIHTLGNQGHQS